MRREATHGIDMLMALTVVVATPLEAELAERIAAEVPAADVLVEPALLPPVRYPGDHRGDPGFTRPPDAEQRWWQLLARAEVLFGIPGDTPGGLAEAVRRCPGLRWVQATSAGAGEQVLAAELTADELARVTVTTSSGVHAGPLAEFALLGMLAFTKELPRLRRDQHAHRWGEHRPLRELAGGTCVVVGLGAIGREVARSATALGMRVLGVRRTPGEVEHVDEVHDATGLPGLAARADVLVVTLPGTAATAGLVSAEVIGSLPAHAVVVNVGRGSAIDEAALADALAGGRLAGAALDVTATEPPAPGSPLWDLDNVLLSPHTAALSARENERIAALFVDNLRRYLEGKPLRNTVEPGRSY